MFLGAFEHTVDDRGRIAIPAKWRADLGKGLVVTRGIDRCLSLWPMDQWQTIAQKLSQLSLMQADARRIHRLIFSGATDTTPDRLGRILLPAFLREYAELRESVVLAGLNDHAEIWSRESWRKERSDDDAQSAQLAEHLLGQGI